MEDHDPLGDRIQYLVEARQEARAQRNYQEAGRLQQTLRNMGVWVSDKQRKWVGPQKREGWVPYRHQEGNK